MRLLLPILALALLASGCFTITRTESDLYTITQRDTTLRENVTNMPGERENGTIYPSPRTVDIHRRYVQEDSTVNRYYPAFLRMGGIEAASFITPGGSTDGAGNGLFGIYDLLKVRQTNDTKIFTANMYRLFPYEVRLRWFEDAPNWTVGTSLFEAFIRQTDDSSEIDNNEYLISVLNGYIRHRIFLRESVPYVMVVPFIGASAFPSPYVNLGATLDVGSLGGFNLRAYAGFVAGSSSYGSSGPRDTLSHTVTFPYFGVGISALDFVNKTEELFIEWKDHKPKALEVSVLNMDMLYSASGNSIFNLAATDGSKGFPSGFWMRFASASFTMPFIDNPNLFVGTSLFSMMAFNDEAIAGGFLPIRAGYRINLLNQEIFLEPFFELTYYPSTVYNFGGRLNFTVFDWLKANALVGFMGGTTNDNVIRGIAELVNSRDLESNDGFSTIYLGIGVGLADFFHTPQWLTKGTWKAEAEAER